MGRFDKKEPKLNEVKAVLQRLQGFPEDETPAPPPPDETRCHLLVELFHTSR